MSLKRSPIGFTNSQELPSRAVDVPLIILVGLTGVGKSSVISAVNYPTLPDRREVVDRFVLPLFGHQPGAKLDRTQRFEITRKFREQHPGGVAEALLEAWVQPLELQLFDGLRGEDEVRFALEKFPRALFVVLGASDLARLSRLLKRGDSFDNVGAQPADLEALKLVAKGVFSESELETAMSWGVPTEELAAKMKIVAEERKNYDPNGARRVLEGNPRAIFLDTEVLSVDEEAEQIRAFVANRQS